MNTKMKVLSLALLGLCGYAGSAMADCPSGPTIAEGGAWTSKFVSSGSAFNIVPGGLEPTSPSACKATSAIAASLAAAATVTDDSPNNEASYRFQFLVDPTAFGNFGLTDSVVLFRANSANAANGSNNLLTVYLVAGSGGTYRIRFNAACSNAANNYRCAQTMPTNLPAGVTRVEGKLTVGADGALTYWINAPQGTTEPAETGSISGLTNTDWVGVKRAILGLSGPTTSFKNAHAGQAAGFDAFDSRRQTYIGW
jgi:hypothetical protein